MTGTERPTPLRGLLQGGFKEPTAFAVGYTPPVLRTCIGAAERRGNVAHSGSCGLKGRMGVQPRRGGGRIQWRPLPVDGLVPGCRLTHISPQLAMARTYTQLLYHIVFSTKNRERTITPEIGSRLHAYLGGILRSEGGTPLLINGVEDHVHILTSIPAAIALSGLMAKLKAHSSGWVHGLGPEHRTFAWQLGYSAFSVSCSQKLGVLDYIAKQEEHHRHQTFQEELLIFLKRHEIQYDDRYVFE